MFLVATSACASDVRQVEDPEVQVASDYAPLIGGTWSLPAGANIYRCVRFTATHDMYITGFKAQAPDGTHHAVLSLADERLAGPDGELDCDANAIGKIMLFASSVGTPPFSFPPDVGIRVRAGQQLHLNLHLFNAGDELLAGETAVLVKSQPTPPPQLAEMVLAGPMNISVPSNAQPTSVSGDCTATSPYTLFALWPHMHTFATKQKVEHVRGNDVTVLHDEDFVFDEQRYYPLAPMTDVAAGSRIRVTCTYINASGTEVTYGDGRFHEMCFSGLYRFPATDAYEYCGE